MSQYTSIFLKKDKTFIEISCTGRSSSLSNALYEYAPYEKISRLTKDNITEIINDLNEKIKGYEEYIDELKDQIREITTFNNSVEDKCQAIEEYNKSIKAIKDEIDSLNVALIKMDWLLDIVTDTDNKIEIYIGVECGPDVSEADIIN